MRKTSSLPNSGADSADYPFGSIIDENDSNKGTPVIEATYSDFIQSLWHFFIAAGVNPNGKPDNTTNGFQLFEAMERYLAPIGIIRIWAGSLDNIPDGWISCNGQNLTKVEYPELFTKIGYTYGGEGDLFKLPSFTDRFPVGGGYTYPIGRTGGEAQHTLTISEIPAHKHEIQHESGSGTSGYKISGASSVTPGYSDYTQNAGGGQSHNNMPPYLAVIFIIKVKYGAGIPFAL